MSPILIEIVTSDNDKFGYIGNVDGIEYPTRSEALEANPDNWAKGADKTALTGKTPLWNCIIWGSILQVKSHK